MSFQDRTGETNIANCGMKMTIIAYRNSTDIDIQFEDGTLVTNRQYSAFVHGSIKHPNDPYNYYKKIDRLGETRINKDGNEMTIIAYRTSKDMDVKFTKDGLILHEVDWRYFENGTLCHPTHSNRKTKNKKSTRHNQTNFARNGLKITIIDYINEHNCTMRFEDGTLRYNVDYKAFANGAVKHPTLSVKGRPKRNVTGTLYNTKITGLAYQTNTETDYFCECPICGAKDIWNFKEIKNHTCNQMQGKS